MTFQLTLHNTSVRTVFDLLGQKENDITYSIGWALANSQSMMSQLLSEIVPFEFKVNLDLLQIRLQAYEAEQGTTDIEIQQGQDFYIIIEAKKGYIVPTEQQIIKYANRESFKRSTAKHKWIVILSQVTKLYFDAHVSYPIPKEITVSLLTYKVLHQIIHNSKQYGSHAEKRLLSELSAYLEGIMSMQNQTSNKVYVVSISLDTPEGWAISWRDIVEKKKKYFHPVGGGPGGWPSEPPNYIAFRYYGKLQSIHHCSDPRKPDSLTCCH